MRFTVRQLIGGIDIVAGAAGLLGQFNRVASAEVVPPAGWPAYWIASEIAFYAVCLVAGLLLLGARRPGRVLATVVEGLKVVAFHTGTFGYLAMAGIAVPLTIGAGQGVSVGANFTTSFGVGPAMVVRAPFLMVNLLSPAVIWAIWRSPRRSVAPEPSAA